MCFLNYIYCELVTLWPFMIRELYERCYRKFGYKWKIMTLNPHRTCEMHVMRLIYIYIYIMGNAGNTLSGTNCHVASYEHCYWFRSVPAGTAEIFRTGMQTGTGIPHVLPRVKFRAVSVHSGHSGQFRLRCKFQPVPDLAYY